MPIEPISKETNKTNTRIEAFFDTYLGYLANGLEACADVMDNPFVSEYVVKALNQIVWASPLLTAQVAPKTFSVTCGVGIVTGFFSQNTMERIFTAANTILCGGKKHENSNLKVALIFAVVLASNLLPVFPSLPIFYASVGGMIFGIKVSGWVPDAYAIPCAQKVDGLVMAWLNRSSSSK